MKGLSFVAATLMGVSMSAHADLVTFTATGSPDVTGYVQFDDSGFAGGTFDMIPNSAITDLSLRVRGYSFALADVNTLGYTYIDSSGPAPVIVNGGGPMARHGLEAIAFFPDGASGTANDGDASLALDLDGDFTTAEHVIAVRWTTAPEPGALLEDLRVAVIDVGPGKSLARMVSVAQTYYAADDVPATCAVLDAFLNAVRAQSGKKIAPILASDLADDAQTVMTAIGCE